MMTSRLGFFRGVISTLYKSGRSGCSSCRNGDFTGALSSVTWSSRMYSTKREREARIIKSAVEEDIFMSVSNRVVKKEETNIPPIEAVIASDPAFQTPDYFQVHNLFTSRDLFDARVHLGHKVGSLNHHMNDFIFGSRFDSVIFDLDKTTFHLRQALNFVAHIAFREGIILFVSRSPHTMHLVEKTAIECGEYAHCREWNTEVLTNSERKFGGITRLPDVLIMLNTLDSVLAPHTAINDANKMLIPVVGIVDSNCDPNLITYPVPGNDDTTSAIQFYCKVFKEAILRGKQKRRNIEQQLIENSKKSSAQSN